METSTASVLCNSCCGLFDRIEHVGWTSTGSDTFHSWEDKTFNPECAMCTAFPNEWMRLSWTQVTILTYGGRKELTFRRQDGLSLRLVLIRVEVDDNLYRYHREASFKGNTGSHKVLHVASEWISRCVHGHCECKSKNLVPDHYPSRLLEIEEDAVRLVERDRHHFEGPYATLSHSWGEAQFKMLTVETLPEFRNGFRPQDLPPTFRDAIYVARYLKIPFLWVDCYCILQSGGARTEDQQHEIARMGEVYSSACLNIGAAFARSPMDGLFVQRTLKPTHQIRYASKTTGKDQLYHLLDGDQLFVDHFGFVLPENSSMFSRAWCMQERFLTPRMLHFCKSAVFWECNTVGLASDRLPIEHNQEVLMARYHLPPPFSAKRQMTDTLDGRDAMRTTEWAQIVDAYSAMELSRPTEDKFDACGGIAKLVAELLHDEYVAGFFR